VIQWDATGVRGIYGRYEVSLVPKDDGWVAIIWIGKSHLRTQPIIQSKRLAQDAALSWVLEWEKTTERVKERINYDGDEPDED